MIVGLAPSSKIRPEPYGVTLVIGSWNYPMSTTVEPAVGELIYFLYIQYIFNLIINLV
jgi:hypothetical protein